MDLNDRENLFPYIRSIRDGVDPPNIVHLLNSRQIGVKRRSVAQMKQFAELKASVSEMKETHCDLPASARSTFLMSFSHDCTKVASTHGDHNIYVSDVKTGKHIRTLEGHPRTPWCIAFHPTSNEILASGCLAGEVRVWDLHGGSEKWKAEHDQVIASLTFHPTCQLLVIATGNSLHFWDWSIPTPGGCCSTNSELERVRYVKFDLYGHRLITGISNLNGSTNTLPTNAFGECPYSSRNHSSHLRHSTRDLDDPQRTSRRSIMERLRSLPEYDNTNQRRSTSRSHNANRSDRILTASSSSSSSSSSSYRAHRRVREHLDSERTSGTSSTERPGPDRPNGSRSSGVENESRSYRDDRSPIRNGSDISPATVRGNGSRPTSRQPSIGDPRMLITETFTDDLRRLFEGWLAEEFGPFITSSLTESSSTESHQAVRTSPDHSSDMSFVDNPRTVPWVPTTHAERSQLPPYSATYVQSFTLPSGNNPGTSADQQNSSLSDHDYLSESDPPQSRANNEEGFNESEPSGVRGRENDSDFFTSGEFWHTFHRLRGICTDLEQRLSRQVYLQRNDASEPRAGPSLNDGGSGINHSAELPVVPRSDNGEVEHPNPYIPIINMLSRIRLALRFSTISLTAVRDRIDQIRRRIREIITRIRYWTGGRHVGRIHQDIFEEMTVQLTEQMDRLLQTDVRLANTMTLSEESAGVQASEQSSAAIAQHLSLLTPSDAEEIAVESYHMRASEVRNAAFRNPSRPVLHGTVERLRIPEARIRVIQGPPVSRIRVTRRRFNPLSYARSLRRNSRLGSHEELSGNRYQRGRLESLDLDSNEMRLLEEMHSTPGIMDSSPSAPVISGSPPSPVAIGLSSPVALDLSSSHLTIDVPSSSPLTINILSSPAATDVPSSSATAGIASAPMNAEESFVFMRNYSSQSRTLDLPSDGSDDDLPRFSRMEIDDFPGIDGARAEASTRFPSASTSTSRNYPRSIQIIDLLGDISDTDDDIFNAQFNEQSDVHGRTGAAPTAWGSTLASEQTREYYERARRLQVEDISDTELDMTGLDVNTHYPLNPRRYAGVPSPGDLDLFNVSGSRTERARMSRYFDPIIEPISDASSDDSDRPITPPLLMYSPTYNSLLFNGNSRIALNDPLTQNHRIQVWDFKKDGIPLIYDATANIVVRRCMIHNDASVDISQDGEKLVALIPPEDRDPINNLMFGVFSLKPGSLGRTLCIWGYISNAISVSFSPLAQYVVVGSAYSRPIYSNPEKAAVAQIIKLNKGRDTYDASYIRSFTQVINNENRFQQVSLNCVRWLPMSGLGIAYATNRGCLCICKPIAGEIFESVPNEPAQPVERNDRGAPFHAFMRP